MMFRSNYNRFFIAEKWGVVLNGQDIIEASLFDNLTSGRKAVSLEEVRSLLQYHGPNLLHTNIETGF